MSRRLSPLAVATLAGAAALACSPSTPAAPTPSAEPPAPPSGASPEAAGPGTIVGTLCYPSEPPLPPITLFFRNESTQTVTALAHTDGTMAFTIDLPAGTYVAYAWQFDYGTAGSYSQAVPCGLTVSCTDHSLIAFTVAAGQTVSGIDICDWYGAPGDVPAPPGGAAASPGPPPTAAAPPPPGGVSLNCDGTYQRFRLTDGGAAGRTAWVDRWDGASWVTVSSLAGGDPMVRQIESEAGLYSFGGCAQLVVIPLRYAGSGAYLELSAYAWNGGGLTEVYQRAGAHAAWSAAGADLRFEESVYLYGEPNCCPCNRQAWVHTWDGAAFTASGTWLQPIDSGVPRPECTPSP